MSMKCTCDEYQCPCHDQLAAVLTREKELTAERDEIKEQLSVQDAAYKLLYDRILKAEAATPSAGEAGDDELPVDEAWHPTHCWRLD